MFQHDSTPVIQSPQERSLHSGCLWHVSNDFLDPASSRRRKPAVRTRTRSPAPAGSASYGGGAQRPAAGTGAREERALAPGRRRPRPSDAPLPRFTLRARLLLAGLRGAHHVFPAGPGTCHPPSVLPFVPSAEQAVFPAEKHPSSLTPRGRQHPGSYLDVH